MSNPTELPDLDAEKANFESWAGVKYRNVDAYTNLDHDIGWQAWRERARRAQSNGKGSQVDALYKQYWAQWPPASSDQHAQSGPVAWVYECRQPGDDKDNWAEFFSRNKPNDESYIRNTRPLYAPAATLSPLCGAQHAESGKECDTCNGTGQYSYETSGSAEDGNAPVVEPCPECAYAQQAAAPGALAQHCPFCGSTDEVYHGKVTYCDNCGADGPSNERDGQPVAKWSDRVATSAPGTPEAPKKPAHGHRDDYYLLANGRRLGLEPISRVRNMPNWVLAMELFATGSTSAHQLCHDAGIDPDSTTIQRTAAPKGGV